MRDEDDAARKLEFVRKGTANDIGQEWDIYFCGAKVDEATAPWDTVRTDTEREWLERQYRPKAHNVVRMLWNMANGGER